MTRSPTVSVSADCLGVVKRYAELAGITARAAIEHAINQTLIPELEDYLEAEELPEVEYLTELANSKLPEDWCFNTCQFLADGDPSKTETMIGLNFGHGFIPTYIRTEEVETLSNTLSVLPTLGGEVVIGGTARKFGNAYRVRRQGDRAILFQELDPESMKPTGKTASIANASVSRIRDALNAISQAAAKLSEEE